MHKVIVYGIYFNVNKYDGMNIVEAVSTPNKSVHTKKKGGALKIFFAQVILSALILFGVFAGKIFKIEGYQKVEEIASAIIEFDLSETIKEWLNFD